MVMADFVDINVNILDSDLLIKIEFASELN